MLILGIESSCDETAAAVVEDGRRLLGSVVATQFELHAAYGGVVPELAARRHLENIVPVIQGALDQAGVTLQDLDGIAATQRPGLIGALVVGMAVAKAMSYSLRIPLAGVHHLESHIAALWLTDSPPPCPFVALVVSGGHTNLYRVDSLLSVTLLSRTRDDAAGEAFDKVAKLMGLGYPGGVVIEAWPGPAIPGPLTCPGPASSRNPSLSATAASRPRWPISSRNTRKFLATPPPGPTWPPVFRRWWWKASPPAPGRPSRLTGCRALAVCGGVAANGRLRQVLQEKSAATGVELFLPPLSLCTDNAGMVAALGYYHLQAGKRLDLAADVFSRG